MLDGPFGNVVIPHSSPERAGAGSDSAARARRPAHSGAEAVGPTVPDPGAPGQVSVGLRTRLGSPRRLDLQSPGARHRAHRATTQRRNDKDRMTPLKSRLLDDYVSPKILFGPSGSAASRPAAEALRRDPRYQRLSARLAAAGFFEPAPAAYAARIALLLAVFAAAFAALLRAPAWPARIACWAAIGFALVQGGFVSHEATHGAISKRPIVAQAVGQCFQTLLVGLAFSYFWRSHELHHFHVNEEGYDPDTVSGLLSVFPSSALQKRGLGRLTTRLQHVLVVVLSPAWGVGLKWDSLTYVLRNPKKTRIDQVALALHAALWFGLGSWCVGPAAAIVNYLGWLAFAGVYMFLVIPWNHVGKRQIHDGASLPFLEQQLATTRNLGTSFVMDFLLMGQNCHVEHHLFPSVPAARLGRGRRILREFCREEGLPYREHGYLEGMGEALRHLAAIARGSALLAQTDPLGASPPGSTSTAS
jgi:fatty acid desaturase